MKPVTTPPAQPAIQKTNPPVAQSNGLENPFPEGSEEEADNPKPPKNSAGELKIIIPPPKTAQPKTNVAPKTTTVKSSKDNSFPNPFPNGSEADADKTQNQGNPFSGLKISNDPPKIEKPVVKPTKPKFEIRPANPPKIARKIVRPPITNKPVAARKPKKKTVVKRKSNPHAEKLRRIAERRGLPGLKGFCPVVLRDKRDLADANPQIHATYQGRRYTFSSEEAKAAFEAAPQKYAPVKGGKDIIALASGSSNTIGSLDYAVWFKDRLYLFSNAKSLKTFTREPKKFAIMLEEK